MRSFLLPLFLILFFLESAFPQNPQKGFSFQGYARTPEGAAIVNTSINVRITIYKKGSPGTIYYSENPTVKTDAYGVFHLVAGTYDDPVKFRSIPFSTVNCAMKVEVKDAKSSTYTTISDTELLSVPYAKAADNAAHSRSSDSSQTAINAISANNGVPVGTILPFGAGIDKLPPGYLACNGFVYSKNLYPALYAVIGTNWGMDANGTDPSFFTVPDLRGFFLRGVNDSNIEVDPDRMNRTSYLGRGGNAGNQVGSYQWDAVGPLPLVSSTVGLWNQGSNGYGVLFKDGKGISGSAPVSGSAAETRPRNAYVWFIIKY